MITDVPRDHPLLVQFRENPYPLYQYLLANAPVQWNDVLGAWTLARYADVAASLTDPRFSADRTRQSVSESSDYEFAKSMLVSDPPDHTRLRALVSKAFTPRMVEQLRPRIIAIVGELLGVPAEDRVKFQQWSAVVAASLDPLVSSELANQVPIARDGLHRYLRGIIAERRRAPRSDLISALVAVEERGDVLSEPERVVMCTLLLIAGHETTVNLIGNGMLALLRHADQLEKLRVEQGLIGVAIEELLRFDSPVQMTGRIALEPVDIDGHTVQPGEWILPLLGAANHDPAQFADPDNLDLARNPNPHVAFGRGIHFCLGAPLARLEGQIAIGALVRRFPNLQLAGEPVRRNQITLRGLQSLPVTV